MGSPLINYFCPRVNSVDETLADRLKRLMAERSVEVTDLVRATGLREGAVYKILRGDTKQPEFATGTRLARALGVSAAYLAGVENESQPEATFMFEDGTVVGIDVQMFQAGSADEPAPSRDDVVNRLTQALAPARVIGMRKLRDAGVSLAPPDLHQLPQGTVSPMVESLQADLQKTMQRVDDLTRKVQEMAGARAVSPAEAEPKGATPQSRKRSGSK